MKKKLIKAVVTLLSLITLVVSLAVYAAAESYDFNSTLSKFPKSYHAQLKQLHQKYPKWKFVPFKTGLDFVEVVKEEQAGNKSLTAQSSVYSPIFKSKSPGDYDPETDKFIAKDGNFVTANSLCVAYFLDPRNFLHESAIFQFELLSFDEQYNIEAIEAVLKGSFMANAKIEYYNSKGTLVKTNTTYSKAMYNAGKEANVNPCFLASKILNEIGNTPSGSVSGKNQTYPGIYNFYNIGATDGVGAITRGLAWAAKENASYGRPWNTPIKSINGGAKFIADNFVAKGQFSAYLQRFNVNKESGFPLYTHQYMTNVFGAAVQAYSSYLAYMRTDLLDNAFVFSIPVYDNMDDSNGDIGKVSFADSKGLKGKICISSSCNVRKGPSTNNERYTEFQLQPNTQLDILEIVKTDSLYYLNILQYPYWCKVKFAHEGKSYTGYVPLDYVQITSFVDVSKGGYKPKITSNSSKARLHLLSLDEKIANASDQTVSFIKNGKVNVVGYDSTGRFSLVGYRVSGDKKPDNITGIKQSKTTDTQYTLSWNTSANANCYEVSVFNSSVGAFEPIKTVTEPKITIKSSAGKVDTYIIRAVVKNNSKSIYSDYSDAFTATTKPAKAVFKKTKNYKSNGYTLNWNKIQAATGYALYKLNKQSGKYTKIKSLAATSYVVDNLKTVVADSYKIRAYIKANGVAYYGAYSNILEATNVPKRINKINVSNITDSSYTLSWSKSSGANGYRVFRLNPSTGKFATFKTTSSTKINVTKRNNAVSDIYTVKPYVRLNGEAIFGEASNQFKAITRPAEVKSVSQTATTANSYKLTWKAVNGADGYSVYKYTGKKWKKVKAVTTTSLTVENLEPCQKNKYKIAAFIRFNGGVYYGDYSTVFTATTAPKAVSKIKLAKQNKNDYTISWSKVENAVGYRLFKLNKKTGKYATVATTKATSYTVKLNKSAKSETFIVKAYTKNNNTAYFSAASKPLTVKK